ncbi:MAG: histidine kinase dimerization/phosphoacceptor domain-containing protein [Ornithinimicrobium sp.]
MPEDRPQDAWEALPWAWTALFHVTVLGSLAIALVDEQRTGPLWLVVALSVLLMAWHEIGLRLAGGPPETWRSRANARLTVIVVDIAIWSVLVSLSPAFYLALFGLVLQIFRHLPLRQAAIAAGLTTVAVIVEQVGGVDQVSPTDNALWLAALIAVAVLGLGGWIGAVIEQSTRRREFIAQLEATQGQLAEAERRAGVLEERSRLAREIHDTLAQGFVSIILHLEAVEEAGHENPDVARRHLDQARTTARKPPAPLSRSPRRRR